MSWYGGEEFHALICTADKFGHSFAAVDAGCAVRREGKRCGLKPEAVLHHPHRAAVSERARRFSRGSRSRRLLLLLQEEAMERAHAARYFGVEVSVGRMSGC